MNAAVLSDAPLALEVDGLAKAWVSRPRPWAAPVRVPAVRGVSLRLARGRTLGLVGESGCGKSTLARMILGLLRPDEGQVQIDGREVDPARRMAMARLIQPVFQDPGSSLNPRQTVGRALRLPLDLHGDGEPAGRDARVLEMLDRVGLPARAAALHPAQLSGGQRQRVAIARALMLRPRLLVCDEPTSALDVSVQAQILNLLLTLQAELGLSYLFISHDLPVVRHVSDHVVVMHGGRIVESGPAAEVFAQPQQDYTRQLLASAPRL
jgi:peptide/nickel transport system ATP-binding protein